MGRPNRILTKTYRARKGPVKELVVRVALAISFLSLLGGSALLEAAGTRGATVSVKMTDGARISGELVRVGTDGLVVAALRSGAETVIGLDKIASIQVFGARRFEPRALNGGALGVFLGLLGSSAGGDYHRDYEPSLTPALFGAAGFLAGLGLEAVGKRSEVFSFDGLSSAVRSGPLRSIAPYSRDYRAGRHDRLRGFRVSLRPYFHPPLPIRLEGGLSLPDPYAGLATGEVHPRGQEYPNRMGRARIDYGLRPWIFLGLEYVSLGSHQISGDNYPKVVRDGQDYVAGLFTGGRVASSAAFLGASVGAASGPRIELGAGPAFSSLEDFGPRDGLTWVGDAARSIRLKSSLALELGASWEFSPGEPVSGGVFASYMFLKPTLPATTFNGSLNFYPGTELSTDKPAAFRLASQLAYPSQRIDLSGFNFGVFIRVK